jgi:nicotinamide phosphoribosyltransferase
MTISAASMQKDVYKEFHVRAYHPTVSEVYSNFTSRSGKLSNIKDGSAVTFVGLQYFILDYLIHEWNESFFRITKSTAVGRHKRIMSAMLGYDVDVKYLEDLHDLGYLPLEIKALPEGTPVPYQVAPVTFRNTHPNFAWLPNMIESVFSCDNWHIQTTATTAVEYYKRFKDVFEETEGPTELLPFMCHDFSMRGLPSRHVAATSGFGFLASGFAGTDSIPAVLFAEKYYGANVDEELVGVSVDATEHSVTCSWINEGEEAFMNYLMSVASPRGILSVVSDTWDYWSFVTELIPRMKDRIMARDGKIVVRPDSGDPVDIICGTERVRGLGKTPEEKGTVECLWETFGGTTTSKGYDLLDEHIGVIYGDSITLERQSETFDRLKKKRFVPAVVLGVGSYSFQYVTRDTHGSAVKATNVIKDGKDLEIFKSPKTDSAKKSAKGLLRVENEGGKIVMYDQQTREQEKQGLLETVFLDGKLTRTTTLKEIRSVVDSWLKS